MKLVLALLLRDLKRPFKLPRLLLSGGSSITFGVAVFGIVGAIVGFVFGVTISLFEELRFLKMKKLFPGDSGVFGDSTSK